jgi:hypothetical protein
VTSLDQLAPKSSSNEDSPELLKCLFKLYYFYFETEGSGVRCFQLALASGFDNVWLSKCRTHSRKSHVWRLRRLINEIYSIPMSAVVIKLFITPFLGVALTQHSKEASSIVLV